MNNMKEQNTYELANNLLGTCMSLQEAMENQELIDSDIDFDVLDEEVRVCDWCGWWHESCEIDENGSCPSCRNEDLDSDLE